MARIGQVDSAARGQLPVASAQLPRSSPLVGEGFGLAQVGRGRRTRLQTSIRTTNHTDGTNRKAAIPFDRPRSSRQLASPPHDHAGCVLSSPLYSCHSCDSWLYPAQAATAIPAASQRNFMSASLRLSDREMVGVKNEHRRPPRQIPAAGIRVRGEVPRQNRDRWRTCQMCHASLVTSPGPTRLA
jgi:hypothetical protein